MAVELICPTCGHVNRSTGMFCAKCGGKMGVPEIRQTRKPIPILPFLRFVIKSIVLLAVLGGAAAVFWPLPVPKGILDTGRAQIVHKTFQNLKAHLEARQQGQPAPASDNSAVFTDDDINQFLAWRIAELAAEASSGSGTTMTLQAVQVRLLPGAVRVVALGQYGPIRLSYEIEGRPTQPQKLFPMKIHRARLGHFPIFIAAGRDFAADRIVGILAGLDAESWVLQNCRLAKLEKNRMAIVTN